MYELNHKLKNVSFGVRSTHKNRAGENRNCVDVQNATLGNAEEGQVVKGYWYS